jgi:hypothetical protein
MQSLGKALPARRAGASSIVKPETTPPNDSINNTSVPQTQQPPVTLDLGQPTSQHPKWTNSTHPQGPPPSMSAPNVQPSGPPIHVRSFQIEKIMPYQCFYNLLFETTGEKLEWSRCSWKLSVAEIRTGISQFRRWVRSTKRFYDKYTTSSFRCTEFFQVPGQSVRTGTDFKATEYVNSLIFVLI